MKTKILMLFICYIGLSNPLRSQSLDETIEYINAKLTAHRLPTRTQYLKVNSNKNLHITIEIIVDGFGTSYLNYRVPPSKATYVNSTLDNENRSWITLSFKPNSVEVLGDDGSVLSTSDQIIFRLDDMTKEESSKIVKAYKHIIKSLGGEVKDELF